MPPTTMDAAPETYLVEGRQSVVYGYCTLHFTMRGYVSGVAVYFPAEFDVAWDASFTGTETDFLTAVSDAAITAGYAVP